VDALVARRYSHRMSSRFTVSMSSRIRLICVATAATLCVSAPAAVALTTSGDTSQHGTVRVAVTRHDEVTGLVIQLRTRCTDHKSRAIWPGFQAPFAHPQDAAGTVADSYDIVGRDAVSGVRFRQRASFKAVVKGTTLTGSASVTQTLLASGAVCKSGRVTFRVQL